MTQPSFPPEVAAILGEIYDVKMPKQGATSQVWIVECAAGMRVVKYAPMRPFRDWLFKEALVLRALALSGQNLPTPPLYFDGNQVPGMLPYIVMGWLPGEPLSAAIERTDVPEQRFTWMRAFGTVLRRIHDIYLSEGWQAYDWLSEKLDLAASYIREGYDLDADDPPRLLEQMHTNRPARITQTFIHGDFMWDNVLVQGDQISGIVDWGGGAVGDPRYDLALAILPHEDGEISSAEVDAFYAGYGCDPLTESEYRYFTNLYEFF